MTVDATPQLLDLATGTKMIQLGLDILAGRVRAVEEARTLVEDILAAAAPVAELAPALDPVGRGVAESVADAAEDLKFPPEGR